MLRRIASFALLAALAAPTALHAQNAIAATDAGTKPEPTMAARIESLRVAGFTGLYSLDYDAAGKSFDEIVKIAPDRPQGYLYRATNIWFKSLYDKRLLSLSLYNQDDFYAQKERTIDPAIDRAFRADLQKAISASEAILKANPKDIDALYYLGAAHGALGGYEATMAHAFISALKHGSKAVDIHEKVLKMEPKYDDAYLTIGMYHYVVGSLPLFVKVMVALGGVKGSKRDGLAELERVANANGRTADDARVILAGLYAREDRLDDSLTILRQLKTEYPANYIVRIEEANTLVRLGKNDQANAAFEELLRQPRAVSEARDYIEYAYGDALMKSGAYALAIEHLARVWQWKESDPDLVTLAHLMAGQAHDALGQRPAALAEYKIVERRADVLDSRKRAAGYAKKAYAPSLPMASTGQL